MSRILVLDDDITRQQIFKRKLIGHDVVQTSTVKSTIKRLEDEHFDAVFLDHDLGGTAYVDSGPGTGWEVAKWLANNPGCKPAKIFIHSFNPVGASNMARLLPEAVVCPGVWNKL